MALFDHLQLQYCRIIWIQSFLDKLALTFDYLYLYLLYLYLTCFEPHDTHSYFSFNFLRGNVEFATH